MRPLHSTLLLLFLSNAALAAGPATYLSPESVDWKSLLAPPVPANSPEHKAELDLIVAVQTAVSPTGIKAAKEQIGKMDVNTFADILGPWFTEKDLPKTEALFHEIEAESKKLVTGPAKKFFQRVRPADADKRVIGHEKEDEFSYPSGHSTRGAMYAYVLASLFPELQVKLITRAQEVGFNRIIVGAHYPSDIVAGRIMGKAIAQRLLATPSFQAALAECKSEMDAVQSQSKCPATAAAQP